MIFNVFAVLFSLVSITMVIPFLGLLFGTMETDIIKPESFTFSTSSIKDHFYYEINSIIESGEKIYALLFNYGQVLAKRRCDLGGAERRKVGKISNFT